MSEVPAIPPRRIKRADIVAMLAHAANVYGRARAIETDEAGAWYMALQDRTQELCERAFQAHFEDTVRGTRFPTIADVVYQLNRLSLEASRDDWRQQLSGEGPRTDKPSGWFRALCDAAMEMRRAHGPNFADRPDHDEEMERRARAILQRKRGDDGGARDL